MLRPDLCVIGGGSAGLSVAAGASQMGASTVLVERGAMGGDCLNTGCVPSKALLAAAKAAHGIRTAERFGVHGGEPTIDFAAVHDHVRGVIDTIAPIDSQERFEGLGVTVIRDHARFVSPDEVEAGGVKIAARRFVVATGSAPVVPAIPGIETVPVLTNETVFGLTACPSHLIVIGGGPIGCELSQAFRRLGAQVTLLERDTILPKDDPDLVDVVRQTLVAEGIDLHERAGIQGVEQTPDGIAVSFSSSGVPDARVVGSHLLVATGRRPITDGLDLDRGGIDHGPKGIAVDAGLRTTNRRVFAIGDVTGGYQFTHVAGYHAGIVIRRALFRLPAKVDERAVPWVTYTDPELAQVGMTEARAREHHGDCRVLTWPMAENDRAQADRCPVGHIKVVTTRRGRILGAGVVGAHAGEVIYPWILAVGRGLKIGAMAGMIAPYPTYGEVGKRAAGAYYTPSLFGPRTRRLVQWLAKLG